MTVCPNKARLAKLKQLNLQQARLGRRRLTITFNDID
jgi:hypothetical protein